MFPSLLKWLNICIFWTLLPIFTSSVQATVPFHVVLDPGHGGSDLGAIYHRGSTQISEKEITLILAQQIASNLRSHGFVVHLTRGSDQEISLADRTAFANRMHADAFISIHTNSESGPRKSAQGVETYILDSSSGASSRRLAHLEGQVLGQVEVPPEKLDVALILKDLQLDANLSESKSLACQVQNELVRATSQQKQAPQRPHKRNRGVKQALFHVLLGADMPSILVETGFLSHPLDRKLLLSHEGRRKIGTALTKALVQYRAKTQGRPPQKLAMASNCKMN